jgi:hypothetical protein
MIVVQIITHVGSLVVLGKLGGLINPLIGDRHT